VRERNDLIVTFLAGGPISRAGQTPVMPFRPRWLRSHLGHRGFRINYNCAGVVGNSSGISKATFYISEMRMADGAHRVPHVNLPS
jgi:hypothetical protein